MDPTAPTVDITAAESEQGNDAGGLAWSGGAELDERGRPRPGSKVGRYLVLDALGQGGMGEVDLAYDPQLDRRVALKLVRGTRRGDPNFQRALLAEARALARLDHEAVVRVFDAGISEGRLFVAMEYVEGQTLRQWIEARTRPAAQVVEVFVEASRGLHAAHIAGIVHRDFKLDNVMVGDDGRVRVMDFGLALFEGPSQRSAPGVNEAFETEESGTGERSEPVRVEAGTPVYMAPEQLGGGRASTLSDQFAFCVSLYEALSGERPFGGRSVEEIRAAQREGLEVKDPSQRIDSALLRVLRRGTALRPEDRYASVADLRADLEHWLTAPRRRRRQLGLALLCLGLAAVPSGVALDEHLAGKGCERDAEAFVDAVWNEARGRRLETTLSEASDVYAGELMSHLRPWADSYAGELRQNHRSLCLAARVEGELSSEQTQRGQWCLDERRDRYDAVLAGLETPSVAALRDAVPDLAGLSSSRACADARSLTLMPDPPAPSELEGVARVRAQTAIVQRALADGRLTDATEAADRLLEATQEVGWAPARIQAQLQWATVQRKRGELDAAEAEMSEAYFAAVRTELWSLAAEAALSLTQLTGEGQNRKDAGELWAELAAAALDKSVDPLSLREATRRLHLGAVFGRAGDFERQRALTTEALELHRAALPADHPDIATDLANLATTQVRLGKFDEAEANLRESLELRRRALGPSHPLVADTLSNLASLNLERGRAPEAVEDLEAAHAIYSRVAPAHKNTRLIAGNLAYMHAQMGRHEEAAKLLEASISTWKKPAEGRTDMDLAKTFAHLGRARTALGQARAAELAFDESLALMEGAGAPAHVDRLFALQSFADLRTAQGRHAEASARLREVLELRQSTEAVNEVFVANDLSNLGRSRLREGRVDEASALCSRAGEIRTRLFPDPASVFHAYTMACTGAVALARGRGRLAVEQLERALGIADAGGVDAATRAEIELALARALLRENDEDSTRKRALSLAARAVEGFRSSGRTLDGDRARAWRDDVAAN